MADVVTFPTTRVRRKRVRNSMDAAGLLSLLLLDREGEAIPDNVRRFDGVEAPEPPKRSPELLLVLFLWNELPIERRECIRRAIRCATYESSPDPCYVQLHNHLDAWLR